MQARFVVLQNSKRDVLAVGVHACVANRFEIAAFGAS